MADIIHLLPDSVANQIAAGEVIQRPASVIKELVENAVDAGAKHIDVLVEDAGRTSIQVIDDGKGMSETDARLAFERHATSKIKAADDLFSLRTMGFRGEALPSIAAVAQVTLKTRAEGEDLGTCLVIEGGKVVSQDVDACPTGSNFMVQNLFYNVPARRKFLKSNQTELSNIMQEFERIALVNPDVHFSFSQNGHLTNTYPMESVRQRISSVFGRKYSDQLLSVEVDTSLCKLTGYVGRPETSRKKGAHQYFFVNGRYMRHPYFQKAVMSAFEGVIPVSEQVPFFLYFQVEPSTIDVNIHPTKTEIKFENEVAIWQIVLAAVKEALGRFNAVPTIEFDVACRPAEIPVYNQSHAPSQHAPQPLTDTSYNPFQSEGRTAKSSLQNWEELYPGLSVDAKIDGQPGTKPMELAFDGLNTSEQQERSTTHYQYRGQYILTETRNGMMIVDQHRAHVRVLYNRYRKQMSGTNGASQRLLFPEMVQFSASDASLLEEIQDEMIALGFDISSLGGGSFSVQGMPAGFEGLLPQKLLNEVIVSLREGGQTLKEESQHRLALTMAYNAAIPNGQVLTQQEMETLIGELLDSDDPNRTPDGKRVLTLIEHEKVEKMFR